MSELTTPTGYTYPVSTAPGACGEYVSLDPPTRCAADAVRHAVDLRELERGRLSATYCREHGGPARALHELAHSWLTCAPPSVGDEGAVLDAGTMALTSEHALVVVRPEGPIWLAYLGIGSHLQQVANPLGGKLTRDGRPNTYLCRRTGERKWRGAHSFASREAATEAATVEWRRGVVARVDEIRRARGGRLDWGLTVEPRAEPRIVLVERGSAWDAYAPERPLPARDE